MQARRNGTYVIVHRGAIVDDRRLSFLESQVDCDPARSSYPPVSLVLSVTAPHAAGREAGIGFVSRRFFLTDLVSIPVVILVSRRAVHESRREFSRRDQWGRVRRSSRKPAYNVGNFPRNPSNMGFGIPAPRKTFLDMSAVRDTGGETPYGRVFLPGFLLGRLLTKIPFASRLTRFWPPE